MQKLVERFNVFARRARIPVEVQREMHLALDEIVSNVLRHGSQAGRRQHIGVELELEKGLLRAEIVDDGTPFNVLAVPDPILDERIGERAPGGLGIYLVKKLMDRLDYHHRDGMNHVILERQLPTGEPEA